MSARRYSAATVPTAKPWVSPPIRWAGSKRSLLPELIRRVPDQFARYIEPFAGSACLFFALRPRAATLSDINPELIHLYATIRRHPRLVARAASSWNADRDTYYEVRALEPTHLADPIRAARFLYLNRLCFNGVYRTNRSGAFNVPFGSRPGPLADDRHLYRCSVALRDATVQQRDFERTIDEAEKDDFVYLDPPYSRAASDAYGVYGYGSFHAGQDLPRMIAALNELDARGTKFMFSYTSTPELLTAAEGRWRVALLDVATRVGGRATSRSTRREVLISNYE